MLGNFVKNVSWGYGAICGPDERSSSRLIVGRYPKNILLMNI